MYTADSFCIDLKGLTDDISVFSYSLDDDYFKGIGAPDVKSGQLQCEVTVKKGSSFFELRFRTEGTIHIPCDRCLDDMAQPISTDDNLLVKFGEAYSEEDDYVVIAEDEGILDIAWLIYEFIVLSIPIRHVHAPGRCNAGMIKLLDEHAATRSDGQDGEEAIDPRWSELSKLLNKN